MRLNPFRTDRRNTETGMALNLWNAVSTRLKGD